MIANMSGRRYRAARTTDSGLPPTPIHVVRRPLAVGGYTRLPSSDARVVPLQVTGVPVRFASSSAANSSSFSSKSVSYWSSG